MIVYKKILKEFLKYFEKKCFRNKQFEENFEIEKGFKILIKEGPVLELKLKGQIQQSNNYALQLYHNAIQAKL